MANKKERISPIFQNTQTPEDPYANMDEDQLDDEKFDQTWGRIERDDLDSEQDRRLQETWKEMEEAQKGRSRYSSHQKLRAALAYTIYASSFRASKASGVPANTIRVWKQEAPWWPVAIKYALEACRESLDAKLGQVVDGSLDAALERLEKGDPVIVKKKKWIVDLEAPKGGYWGEEISVEYVPIKAKDLMVIASIARDKQAILRGEPTSISQKKTDDETIAAIANKLAKAVEDKTPKSIVGTYDKDGNKTDEG